MLNWFVRGLATATKAGNYEFMSCPILCLPTGSTRDEVFGFLGQQVPWLPLGYVLSDMLSKDLIQVKHFAACNNSFVKLQTSTSQRCCLKVAQLHGAMNANKLRLAEAVNKMIGFMATATLSMFGVLRPVVCASQVLVEPSQISWHET